MYLLVCGRAVKPVTHKQRCHTNTSAGWGSTIMPQALHFFSFSMPTLVSALLPITFFFPDLPPHQHFCHAISLCVPLFFNTFSTCTFKLCAWRHEWYTVLRISVHVTVHLAVSLCRCGCLMVEWRTSLAAGQDTLTGNVCSTSSPVALDCGGMWMWV